MRVTLHAERLQQLRQIDRRRFAFHRRIGRHDDFFDAALRDAVDQALDLQLLRPDAAQRRQRAAQHVIEPVELAGDFDADDVIRIFHHADHLLIALRIAAVLAQLGVADVVADGAHGELVFDVENACASCRHRRGWRA
jgi:hypothetical protein